ncbi:MAG TPA: tyrosine-type recombinase/integrase [Myxococcota bacterium]|nr:tyrosine-type recombinase/integrase [Myxococcota bacterium]
MSIPTLGQIVHSFFVDHLRVARGLRPSSIASYRDGVRLFLCFVADDLRRKITRLKLEDLTADQVLRFLNHLEEVRSNHVRTRNQRLAILRTFFDYVGGRVPEMLAIAEQVARVPTKRVAPPETRFLERREIEVLFSNLPGRGRHAARDRTLLLLLYNTGARVQEVASLRVGNIELVPQPRVRLHGKGDKWRVCPLWKSTVEHIEALLERRSDAGPDAPVFVSQSGEALTRFGIYKIVRRHAAWLDVARSGSRSGRVTPHVFRHTAAVHLLEAGVEVNVIRGWLGHVSLETTNRYAEINTAAKEAALNACSPPDELGAPPKNPVWRNDAALLGWLDSL